MQRVANSLKFENMTVSGPIPTGFRRRSSYERLGTKGEVCFDQFDRDTGKTSSIDRTGHESAVAASPASQSDAVRDCALEHNRDARFATCEPRWRNRFL